MAKKTLGYLKQEVATVEGKGLSKFIAENNIDQDLAEKIKSFMEASNRLSYNLIKNYFKPRKKRKLKCR